MAMEASDEAACAPLPKTSSSHSNTLRKPQWTYFHLRLLQFGDEGADVDLITVRQSFNSALSRFMGFMGTTIEIDILKLQDKEVWVRVPRDSSKIFHEAVSGWTGNGKMKYLVKGKDDWLVKLAMGSGHDLF